MKYDLDKGSQASDDSKDEEAGKYFDNSCDSDNNQKEKTPDEELEDSEDDDPEQAAERRKKILEQAETQRLLAKNDLKIKTMAKFKSLMSGELDEYQKIQEDRVDLAYCKGKAFEDSSMEERERSIESEHIKRGLMTEANNFGRNSENSELNGSIMSNDDYWQQLKSREDKHKHRKRT